MGKLSVSLITAGISVIFTAYVVEKKMLQEFDERLERELSESVDFLVDTNQAEVVNKPQTHRVVNNAADLITKSDDEEINANRKIRYDAVIKGAGYAPPEGEVVVSSTLGDIHAISTEEFMENESGFLQSSLSYFADGGVLDEQGELVVGFEDLIGAGRPPFGELSGEPHIVYLRNVKQRREFEVIEDEANAADILNESDSGS